MITTNETFRVAVSLVVMSVVCCSPRNGAAQIATPPDATTVNGLDVKCELGFTNLCDVTRPTSLALLISNYTGQPIEGRLLLIDKWQGYEIDLGDVYLSELQTRRFGSIHDLSEWNNARVELRDLEDKLLWSQELLLQKFSQANGVRNMVMVVGDGQRKAQFETVPLFEGQVDVNAGNNYGRRYRYQNQPKQYWSTPLGTQIETINAETWQIPTHHAPLLQVRAIVFPDYVETNKVNGGQWKAIAEWICLGGRFFVNSRSTDVVKELLAAALLSDEPAHQEGGFSVRPMGVGAIYEYDKPLFLGNSEAAERKVATAIAELTPHHLTEFAGVESVPNDRNRTTDRNRMWIMILFLMYTLLSGIVVLAMFRRTRRQLTIYVTTIVALATIGAGILGANLRFSKGEMRWITISQPGTGGGVQIARLEATSSGARSSVVTMSGTRPDLQVTGEDVRNFYGLHYGVGPFTKQSNLLKNDDVFQSSMKITPWGQRRLYATDFSPDMKRLGLKLKIFEDLGYSMKVVNHLPVDIKSCRIVMMVTADNEGSRERYVESYQFGGVAAGQSHEIVFPTGMKPYAGNTTSFSFPDAFNLVPPVLNRRDGIQVWFLAQLSRSLSMKIDETHSDFNITQDVHLLVQELLPGEYPDRSEIAIPHKTP